MTVSGFDGLVIEAMGLGAPETDNMAGGADTAHDASEDQRASGAGSKSQPGSLCFPKKSGVLLEVARTLSLGGILSMQMEKGVQQKNPKP